jgi:transposase
MTAALEPLDVRRTELDGLVARAEAGPLGEADLALLRAAMQTLTHLAELLAAHGTTIAALRRLLLGDTPPSEKTATVLAQTGRAPQPSSVLPAADTPSPPDRRRGPGHGRQAAATLTGAHRVRIAHRELCPGDPCPACLRGKVYEQRSPQRLIRFRGQSPLTATIYECARLRCNLCGEIFTADPPADVGPDKYDPTAASVIAVLKYGSGVPFTRLASLQQRFGIPLSASTQWDIVRDAATQMRPAFDELQRQAAQGAVLYNDDTSVPILALRREPSPDGRTGCFTSGIVATIEGRQMALYRTGRPHAGENLATVLGQRAPTRPPPIQMCDALARNLPKLPEPLATIVGHCLAHARRRFVAVTAAFPDECRHVLETLGAVYRVDAEARTEGLTPEARLERHQRESAPLMTTLRDWCVAQLDERRIEPNSGLGQAITYCLKHWERLTLFLRVAGAPLDTNIVERALKKAILHRKNALFYKTQRGADVGDLYMSLIHTADLARVNPIDYLTALQQHAADVARTPSDWMPWNYHAAQARGSQPATTPQR